MRGGHVLVKRLGPKVSRERFGDLAPAVEALRAWTDEVSDGSRRTTTKVLSREYEPVQQVVGRGELRGPGRRRCGIDVRGDGSSEAWTGRWARRLVEQRPGEDAGAALARVLGV